ncbi:hypothetical protein Clacol_004007 [Clathrus columnatus]|uniref:Uncharacterized protein n=1 Tax=Clathrus columnatus TaxID=1419009 RepID=A0AAV5A8K1_9AGAM|nr:hypothetical protein Clacol_004007 [Clathrus columnatus]
MTGTNNLNGALNSSYANASASSSRVTLESRDDKRILRKPSRGKLLPWSRRGKKSASAEHVKGGSEEEIGFRDHPIYAERSLSTSPGGSEEALETQLERLMIPPPWPCEDRPENCPSITSVPSYKTKTFYRLHAPAGPPYYINHHLRPPNSSALVAARSPASAFSNSFPPLAALPPGSPPLRTITLSLRAPPDQQHPPLQASQSSPDNVSLTAYSSTNIGFAGASDVSYYNRDNHSAVGNFPADIDHLDVSNPWGQKFHHDSPYDLGQKKGKKPIRPGAPLNSTSVTDLRSRLPSHSRFSRPTTPSPLSQSTPAVNTQLETKEVFGPRRRLSKRKPSGLQAPLTISPSPDSSSDSQHSTSSPIDRHVPETTVSMTSTTVTRDVPSGQELNSTPFSSEPSRKLSKRRPVQFPSTSGYIPPPEKNKGTGNVFGRMAKRFSFGMGGFMSGGKRGMTFERRLGHKGSMSLTDVTFTAPLSRPQNESSMVMRNERPPQQEPQRQGPRRIPPPSLEELPASSVSVSQTTTTTTTTTTSIRKSIVAPTPGRSVAPQLPNIVSDAGFALVSQQFQEGAVRDSLVSTDTEPNWSLGKLTIANPDMVGGSDTDTSLRGRGKNVMSTSRLPDGSSMVDPDPRASIRVEVDSRSFQDLGDRNSRAFTTESQTPTQRPAPLQQQETQLSVPSPPPKEERASVVINGTADTQAQTLRVSVTESSVTTTSRPSSRVSSPDLPPTPQDVIPPESVPPPPISKNKEVPIPTQTSQDSPLNTPIASDRLNLSNAAETPSPTKPRPNGRQEHIYIVDVPVEGSLFVRSAPDGGSVPPVEKPELPPLPPKFEPQGTPVSSSAPSPRHSKDRKETTIFTSLFNTPRGRRTSESPPTEGSSHDHGSQVSPSLARRRTKTSPDKNSSVVSMRTDSAPEKDIRGERVKDRDYYGSRRGDRRSYLEKRDDRDVNSRHVHRENRPRSEEAEQRERERRHEQEERQTRGSNQEKERQRLKEEEERAARRRREREEEESRANKAREREEEERRERKARERDEEQRRPRRAKEREEEEGRLRRIKQKEEEERRAREDEERRARRAKQKEEEERRIRREKERAEEERRARREREEEERKARKIREEEERRKAREEEERRHADEEEKARLDRRRVEEERRRRKEEEEKRAKREEEEKRRVRKEEEEKKARKEEEERRARKEEEERRARKEEEERKARKEEEDRRARKEEEDRRARAEEDRRARAEEDRRARKEEEDRRARKEAQEKSARKQREQEELQRVVRKEKERLEAEKERERKERKELEREFMRQREWELEQRHQEEQSWSQETMRSLQTISGDRPTGSVVGSSYPSIYSSTVGYDWEPVEPPPHRKHRSHDSHEPGRQQVRNRKEPTRLPDYNRRVELGIYPPGSSSHSTSHFRRPRAVSLESASQPPTPPRKEKEYTLRRQQINGHVYPSMSVDDTIFTRPHIPRPVSGFPSPDVFKAREAWEHDRIWRGQSMSFDTNSAVSGTLPTASWTDLRSYSYEPSIPSVSYYSPPPPGSSYTSFMVQPSWSYPHYQTAAPPPPIEPFSIPPSSNPLPPPPRQSNYQFQPPS